MANRGQRGRGDRRRQCGGENEPRRVGANRIDDRAGTGHISAKRTERLGERPFDEVDTVHDAVAFGDAAAARAVHADGVDLVEIGHRAIFLGQVADLADRGDIAIHRIDRLENHHLRGFRIVLGQQPVQILRVVMLEDPLLRPRMANPFDHRVVVEFVRIEDAAGQLFAEGRQGGHVGHIARGEKQRPALPVQAGQFLFQHHMVMIRTRYVSCAAGTGAAFVDRLDHGVAHQIVLAHAEIIVRAPDRHILQRIAFVMHCVGKGPGLALQIGENPVAALILQAAQALAEITVIVDHLKFPRSVPR